MENREFDYLEAIQDVLITCFREFSDKGFATTTTGFQRYYVKDILYLTDLYDQYCEHGDPKGEIKQKFKDVIKAKGLYSEV